jgi:uncharacterized protein (DUF2062 family)
MTPSALHQGIDRLLALNQSPERTALACALGVFFSFSPFLGLQTLSAMAIAFALRLNKLVVFIGLNANVPWIMGPWYAGTTVAAAMLLGVQLPPEWNDVRMALADWRLPALAQWTAAGKALLWPWLVGPTLGAAAVAAAAYAIVMVSIRARRRHHATADRQT